MSVAGREFDLFSMQITTSVDASPQLYDRVSGEADGDALVTDPACLFRADRVMHLDSGENLSELAFAPA